MRIQELRELSFKLSYLPLVYPTFFLCVFLSHRSFSFRVLEKVGIRECKVFREKYYPQGWRFFPKTGGLTLHSRPIPELPLRPERKWQPDALPERRENGGKRKWRQIGQENFKREIREKGKTPKGKGTLPEAWNRANHRQGSMILYVWPNVSGRTDKIILPGLPAVCDGLFHLWIGRSDTAFRLRHKGTAEKEKSSETRKSTSLA